MLPGCYFFLPFKEVTTEDDNGWWDCYADCEICVDFHDTTGECIETKVVSANPDGDPKQICFDSEGTFASPDLQCQDKFYRNLMDAYYTELSGLMIDCTYASPGGDGPIHVSYSCDEVPGETDPPPSHYSSGTETLRSTLLRVNAATSTISITVGGHSDTVNVSGWLQVTESPLRLVQVNLKASEPIVLGSDTWTDVMMVNTGQPRQGTKDPVTGAYVLPVNSMKLDTAGSKEPNHYSSELFLSGVVTGVVGQSTFTATHSYTGPAGSVSINLAGTIESRPPVASFTSSPPVGCTVAVDGYGSTDPDGTATIEHWIWFVNGTPAGSGPARSLDLISGTNLVQLTVVDQVGMVSESRASAVVQATQCNL